MTAERSAVRRPRARFGPGARWRLWGGALAVVVLLAAAPWLARRIRAEIAYRGDAREARRLIAERRYLEASEPLQRWLQVRPDSGEARFLAARGAIGLGLVQSGLAGLDQARMLGFSPRLVDREMGIALARLGRLGEAEPLLRRAHARAAPSAPDPELDEALAKCYLESFQLHEADKVVRRWVQNAPEDARAHYWKGEVGRKTDADEATLIADFQEAVRLDPGHAGARLALAEIFLRAHRLDEAADQYRTHLERHPDDPEAWLGLGQVAAEEGRDDDAVEALEHALKLAPRDNRPLIERGKLETRRGRLDAALALFDRAAELDANEPEVHYQRSLVLTRLGRSDQARAAQERAARLRQDREEMSKLRNALLASPRDLALQYQAATWMYRHGHPEEGVRWAEKILREEPRHPGANRLLADHYQQQGNLGLANFYREHAGPP